MYLTIDVLFTYIKLFLNFTEKAVDQDILNNFPLINMSRDLNVDVIAQAHIFYLHQLKLNLSPLIAEGLISIYEDSCRIESETNEFQGNILKQFQKQLTAIPFWNQSILEEETKRILDECDFLMNLVGAVFVSYVQILASVKLRNNNRQIRIVTPLSDVFIHTVYTRCAETFYYKPYHFQTYKTRESNLYILETINKDIEYAIDVMTPVNNILKEYISDVFTPYTKENPRKIQPIVEEPKGVVLTSQDLGLDTVSEYSPINDEFGTGNEEHHFGTSQDAQHLETGLGGDSDLSELGIGKDPSPPVEKDSYNFDFKDDTTTIVGGGEKDDDIKTVEKSPFSDIVNDITPDEPAYRAPESSEVTNKVDDIFSSNNSAIDVDIFKNDESIAPPELGKDADLFDTKKDDEKEINFFD